MKPQQILDLEKHLGIELKELEQGDLSDWENRNSYQLDSTDNVIGLNLISDQISDYSFLKDLKQLTSLNLSNNKISDSSFLKDLKQLNSLDLSYIEISDYSFLKDLKQLTSLKLSSDTISDYSFLKDLKQLKSLDLRRSIISDYSFLKDLKQLTNLNLSRNPISDYSFLKDLKQLTSLNLSDNKISDYSFLKDLKQLTILDLSFNQISDISFLKDLKQLTSLDLSGNTISDSSFLKELKLLANLDLSFNKISDISFLKDLKQLTNLDLGNNEISDSSFLKDLKQLKNLYLSFNTISDSSFLKDLKQLTNLFLSYNTISDIFLLKESTQLSILDLSNNQIIDISALKKLKQLTRLYLSNNKISDLLQFEFIEELPQLHLIAHENPCFANASIILGIYENDYDTIVNELTKAKESLKENISVAGYLPEKIILLGNHSSGKTSLVHYLQTGNLNYKHNTTHILQIEDYCINKDTKNVLPDAILYDFGGQDFYHGIYQTFLTPNALTLLLWHTEKNSNKSDIDTTKLPIRNYDVNYWLGQWELKVKPSELIVIQTHKDSITSQRKSYSADYTDITEEFYVTLEKEDAAAIASINKAKHSALNYLQESINELINNKRKERNPEGRISKPYYEFIDKLIARGKTQKAKPIKKSELRGLYKTEDDKRFEIDLDQLRLNGMLLTHEDNVWLNPVTLTQHVHDKLSKEKVGKGILTESEIKNLGLSKEVLELLLDQKVIFKHEFGLNDKQEQQTEYIIPNYLPLIESSGIDYDLMVFGLDNPLFVMLFKDFLPFGFINQLICYFGKLPDRKKFWRDQLVFTISETINNETIKLCKVQIKLDFNKLKIEVFAVFANESEKHRNEITEYLYYVLTFMYKNNELADDFEDYKELKKSITEMNDITRLVERKESRLDFYFNYSEFSKEFQIKDLYLSVDNDNFVKQEELLALGDKPTIITYNNQLKPSREKPARTYQSFTPHKIKTMKKIFISYSKDDLTLVNQFTDHLSSLKRDGLVGTWYCTELLAGGEWDNDIQKHFDESDIICIMVSSNLMKTDYIHKYEIAKAFKKKEQNKDFRIVPIVLNYCRWSTKENDLSQFTALPYTAKPVTDFNDKDMAWFIVVECIRIMIEKGNQPEGDDWYNNDSLPKSIRTIYQRIVEGLVDNNTVIKKSK